MNTRHSIIGLLEILKWMEEKGHARATLLDGTGIDGARLCDPRATLLPHEELQFYRNVLRVCDNPNILIEAGFNLKLSAYGVWGLALISSPTVEKAIELGIQFVDFTYTYNEISFFKTENYAGIRIENSQALGGLEKPMIERDISATFVLLQALLAKDGAVEEICLAWGEAGTKEYYESLFSCKIRFNQPYTELRFSRKWLKHELPQHNVLSMQLCTEQLEQTRSALSINDGLSQQVKHYLSSTPLYRVTMEACADGLNMSSRTLRRKLVDEGSSYQEILDEFRCLLADKYLSDTGMTLDEIAERLGYSDAANFSHAYKRWRGCTPRKGLVKSRS